MSVDSLDPQLQTLYDLLKSDIDSLSRHLESVESILQRHDEKLDVLDSRLESVESNLRYHGNVLTVINNGIGRLEESLGSHAKFHKGFIEDTRNRLDTLERKTA